MESYTFKDLITGNAIKGIKTIVIPKIQRDYAQGRKGQKATDVRNLFSSSLIATLKATDNSEQALDFLYGYIKDLNFEPLDGQQRLTTLFLLHWLILPNSERHILKDDNGNSVLSYRTRPAAKDFCNFLVNLDYDNLKSLFDTANQTAQKNNKPSPLLSSVIKEQDDFRYGWELDPTVDSMLRMLNTFMNHFGTFSEIEKLNYSNLNNIKFHIRKLEDLKQGDDLYVKMNARGLELSDFDNTKSALEGDMIESNTDEEIQSMWRKSIDGNWIDFFWHSSGADLPDVKLTVSQIKNIEDNLKTFILRIIALSWFEAYFKKPANEYQKELIKLTELNNTKRAVLNNILTRYLRLRFEDTHNPNSGQCPVIDYKKIVKSLNAFFYKKGEVCLSVDNLADNVKRDDKELSFIDSFLENDFTYVNRVILFGMLTFVNAFSVSQISKDDNLQRDWQTWVRLIRNLTLARNSNSPFDDQESVYNAFTSIKDFINGFVKKKQDNPQYSMQNYIIETSSFTDFDSSIYQEEQYKQNLRKNADWIDALDIYENNGYLFGQLRAPLQWCNGDLETFKKYSQVINRFMTHENNDGLLYAGLLLISNPEIDNYPFNGSLLTFDFNRDRSFKRYLRENVFGTYGPALKKLADKWLENYADKHYVSDFLKAFIADSIKDRRIPLWKRQIAEFPEMILEKSHHRRMEVSDNAYFIESKQNIKRWNVNLCWLKKARFNHPYFVLHNTKEEGKFKNTISGGKLIMAHGEMTEKIYVKSRIPKFRGKKKTFNRKHKTYNNIKIKQ